LGLLAEKNPTPIWRFIPQNPRDGEELAFPAVQNRNAPARPGRSGQQRYCTTRVMEVKGKIEAEERKVK
jgi:hypothetical protein